MKKAIRLILITACLAVFCYAGYMLFSTLQEYRTADSFYETAANQFVTVVSPAPSVQTPEQSSAGTHSSSPTTSSPAKPPTAEEQPEPKETAPIKIDFDSLLAFNSDVVGWLYCDDTVINYPIAKGINNNQYLRTMLDGSYNSSGTLFMDYRCESDFSCDNTVIYGHNMKNGSMFHTLLNYREQDFYDSHPVLYLLTPTQDYALHLFAGFTVPSDSWVYTFWFDEENSPETFLQQCTEGSDFQASFTPVPGDPIITLSTCTYEYDTARYVVLGVLKPIDN